MVFYDTNDDFCEAPSSDFGVINWPDMPEEPRSLDHKSYSILLDHPVDDYVEIQLRPKCSTSTFQLKMTSIFLFVLIILLYFAVLAFLNAI